MPKLGGLSELILEEAHRSRYSIHPGATKMYRNLKPLVAYYEVRCSGFCAEMCDLFTSQN